MCSVLQSSTRSVERSGAALRDAKVGSLYDETRNDAARTAAARIDVYWSPLAAPYFILEWANLGATPSRAAPPYWPSVSDVLNCQIMRSSASHIDFWKRGDTI